MKTSLWLFGLSLTYGLACASETLEPLVVTATSYPIPLEHTLASMDIITRQDIEAAAANDVADLLKFHAGLEIGRNGGPGQATSLFIRGTESDHNLILIDGVPINSGSVGSAALQHIDPQNIERIEIYKGPRSTLWGSGAIGGVINIIMRKGQASQTRGHASLEGGEDRTLRAAASISHDGERFQGALSVSHHQTEGFPTLETSNIDRGYRNTSFDISASADIGSNRFGAQHWQSQGNTEYLDYFGSPLDQDFLNSRSSLSWSSDFSPVWNSRLAFNAVRDHLDENQSNQSVHTDRSEWVWDNRLDLSAQGILVLGEKYTKESVQAQGGFSPYDNDSDILEFWGQYDIRYGAHQLIAGLRHLDHEDAGNHTTWSLNYGYTINPHSELFASAASAFRVPSANERYGFGGNPDLQPEESLSYELGLRHDLSNDQRISASLYQNDIDNLIQWQLVTPPYYGFNQNIAKVRIRGLELGYDYAAHDLDLHLGGNWQNPEDRNSGERLLRRADYSINARLGYTWGQWHLALNALHSGERDDFGGIKLDSYTLVDFSASYRIGDNWQIFAKLANAFDEDYQLASGYNTQGRSFSIGLRYH